jgi:hypothetical protein
MTSELRRYFQAIGREGGKVGGRKTAQKMTAEERQARAEGGRRAVGEASEGVAALSVSLSVLAANPYEPAPQTSE